MEVSNLINPNPFRGTVMAAEPPVTLGKTLSLEEKRALAASSFEVLRPQEKLHQHLAGVMDTVGGVGGILNPYRVAAKAMGRMMQPAAGGPERPLTAEEQQALCRSMRDDKIAVIQILGAGIMTGATVGSSVGSLIGGPPGAMTGCCVGVVLGAGVAFLLVLEDR